MAANGYTREICVSNTPNAAYQALTSGYDKWWTSISNPVANEGDIVTFRFGPTYWVMRASKLILDTYIELECIEAHHIHEGLPSSILKEWEGTKLKWNIEKQDKNTKITLTHEGLVPSLDCYTICEEGWNYYLLHSLKKYLDEGKGIPYKNER